MTPSRGTAAESAEQDTNRDALQDTAPDALHDTQRGRMSVHAHLREAHGRLLKAAAGLAVGALIGYVISDQVLEILRTPIEALAESRNASLNYDSVGAAFDLRMRIAVFAGVTIASPVWLYQAFAFLVPGLTRREKQYTVGFLAAAIPLFIAGSATGFMLFPHIVELLAGFGSTEDSTVLVASYYVDFVMKLVLAVGIAFVVPVLVVVLNVVGALPGTTIVRSWRIVILGILLFCALATPSADVMSMFLLAVPMTGLFAAAAGVAVLHDRAACRRIHDGTHGDDGGAGRPAAHLVTRWARRSPC